MFRAGLQKCHRSDVILNFHPVKGVNFHNWVDAVLKSEGMMGFLAIAALLMDSEDDICSSELVLLSVLWISVNRN